jgi:hypothetical protein
MDPAQKFAKRRRELASLLLWCLVRHDANATE